MEHPKSEAEQIEIPGPSESLSFQDMPESERNLMERKMIRKVDLRLLTMTILMYILNYVDRNNIASAKLAGMQTDLRLHGNQYEVILLKHAHIVNFVLTNRCADSTLDSSQHPFRWLYSDARFRCPPFSPL